VVPEAWPCGRRVGVDSFFVETPRARAAAARLAVESRSAGSGVHISGTAQWDGLSVARMQCDQTSLDPGWVRSDHGGFADGADFYARTPTARNRLHWLNGLLNRLAASGIDRSIDDVLRGA
jgi:hypothetical protein